MNEKRQSLVGHLTELRSRLIRVVMAIGAGMLVSLLFAKEIFRWLQRPLLRLLDHDSPFIVTGPIEAFVTYLKVAILSALFLSAPFIFWQIWQFVAPGLYRNEKRLAFLFVTLTSLFFAGGALFGYFVIFPIGFKFLVSVLEGTGIQFLPQMEGYLRFITRMLLTFGLIFELPVVLTLLGRIGVVTSGQLSRARRYVVVLAFLLAGILTPGPDVLSQLLLALPLLALYEISVIAVRFVQRTTFSR